MKERFQEFGEIVWESVIDFWDWVRRGAEAIGGWFSAIWMGLECFGCLCWLVTGLIGFVVGMWKLIGQGVPQ